MMEWIYITFIFGGLIGSHELETGRSTRQQCEAMVREIALNSKHVHVACFGPNGEVVRDVEVSDK